MIKTLTRHGNSLSLIIDRAVLELLKIEADTPLDITTDGQVLIITPVRDEARQAQFQQALQSVNRRHARVLKRLAE
jgi:antitoxin MazE